LRQWRRLQNAAGEFRSFCYAVYTGGGEHNWDYDPGTQQFSRAELELRNAEWKEMLKRYWHLLYANFAPSHVRVQRDTMIRRTNDEIENLVQQYKAGEPTGRYGGLLYCAISTYPNEGKLLIASNANWDGFKAFLERGRYLSAI
jgi:hypothetical protein